MKAVEIPFSFIIFLVLILIAAVLILFWHFGGFKLFEGTMNNVSCDMINNSSGLTVGCT